MKRITSSINDPYVRVSAQFRGVSNSISSDPERNCCARCPQFDDDISIIVDYLVSQPARFRHMNQVERQHAILAAIGNGATSVRDLAAIVDASEATVRRDVDNLVRSGTVLRRHGSVELLPGRADEVPHAVRTSAGVRAKAAIARLAGTLVRDGECLILDSGTTAEALARELSNRHLEVMPLSLHSMMILAESSTVNLSVPGGAVRPIEGSFTGPLAERTIADLRFDLCFLTCCGISASSGVTAYDVYDAAVKRRAIESAARVIAIADGSKFLVTARALVCDVDRLDLVITDNNAPARDIDEIRAAGVRVEVVPTT
jgi:DeoR/GlpR family transcriptional regulator of sugar metabolism